MEVIDNLKTILTKSYTAWAAYIGIIAQLILEYGFSSGLPTWGVYLAFGLVLLARIIKQKSVSGEATPDEGVEV